MADKRAVAFIAGVGNIPLSEIGAADRLILENLTASDSLIIPSGNAFPGSPTTGDLFWRTDTDALYRYNGASWDAVTAQASSPPVGAVPPPTPSGGDFWYNNGIGWEELFTYDAVRSKWLSVATSNFEWGHDSADGNYLRGSGVIAAGVGTGLLLPRNATIKRISARARAGLATKSFDLLINDVSALSFSLVAGEYINNTLNINANEGQRLWVSASATGTAALDVAVSVWVSWRV